MSSSRSTTRIGWIVRDLRREVGWSQRELARRSRLSQALISSIETGSAPNLTFGSVERILTAMGSELLVDARRPFLGDRERQRDPAHVHCTNHVVRRLERAGWRTATEVEVGSDRSRGWVDVLAWQPRTRVVLIVEIKTEIRDLGAIERTMGWYEREAPTAARRFGWLPRRTATALILLATDANDARLRENREAMARGFPGRASSLAAIVAGIEEPPDRGRAMAMIDPRSKRRTWLRPSRLDGRRTPAPYSSYADFMSRLRAGSAAVRSG